MNLLRIYASLLAPPSPDQYYPWTLLSDSGAPVHGESTLAALPLDELSLDKLSRDAKRIQLVIPAQDILITRAHLPAAARRNAGSVLPFAVEDVTVGEPETHQVSWLGKVQEAGGDDADVLAVLDKNGLQHWQAALQQHGIDNVEVHSEILLLPWSAGEWSLAWNGRDGFVRTGALEGVATDCGDRQSPPLTLHMLLEEAKAKDAAPASITIFYNALFEKTENDIPDCIAWTQQLGIPVTLANAQGWRTANMDAGLSLIQSRQRWRVFNGMASRLRPTAWIIGATLTLQAIALTVDWSQLTHEKHTLRQHMETQFRALFPDAIAVTDPALQMRRKLAEAHDASGQFDNGNFLPMIEQVALAMKSLPGSSVRTVSYESGRMTLELSGMNTPQLQQFSAQLQQAGLHVESLPTAKIAGAGDNSVTIIVRAS
jgi:general secretion pathway protein L